ncbi:PAS domain-containing protein [Geodermatophilus normandii]|uniref:PAS domain-containing protein n=1 Tax=Geodermatophilus normandii TaxID=1137989 RepID=A0A317QIL7_9ACTN|nr:ANTAR domain-containing protein [Geodermatophilus normandii]PWW22724.1 PAS domain-containing protein [Geodermatophilus normandii]
MSADAARPDESPGPDIGVVPDLLRVPPPAERGPDHLLAQLADVQVAHEELRVAEEEMRVQQEQITQLLLQHAAERRWRGQMTALLPLGIFLTDGNGMLHEANPALAVHLGTALQRLRGKPLSVFLAPEDVRPFRSALRELSSGTAVDQTLTVTVHPRRRAPLRAHLFGFTESADHRASAVRVQWVLIPEEVVVDGAPDDREERAVPPSVEVDAGEEAAERISTAQVIGLATALTELSALPVSEGDRQRLLGRMAALIRGAVPAADWVSITLGSPRDPQRLGSDSPQAQSFDGRQVQAAQGPCWDAYRLGSVVVTDDVAADLRWPALAPLVGAGPVRSVLAVPLHEDGATSGAINVYSGRTAAFGPAGRRIGELVAAAVAGVLQNVAEREAMQQLAVNLERALGSRAVIDQAKGILMGRLGVDADDAFARLVALSNRHNVKVRDLAVLVVGGHVDGVLAAD